MRRLQRARWSLSRKLCLIRWSWSEKASLHSTRCWQECVFRSQNWTGNERSECVEFRQQEYQFHFSKNHVSHSWAHEEWYSNCLLPLKGRRMMDSIQISLFSPSILSLHEDGDELEKKLSLNRAMQLFEETGQEHWLNFVIEASGVSDAVEMIRVGEGEEKGLMKGNELQRAELEQERQEMMEKFKDNEGRPLYMTKENVSEVLGRFEKKKIDTLEELNRRIDHQQVRVHPHKLEADLMSINYSHRCHHWIPLAMQCWLRIRSTFYMVLPLHSMTLESYSICCKLTERKCLDFSRKPFTNWRVRRFNSSPPFAMTLSSNSWPSCPLSMHQMWLHNHSF